MQEKIIPVRCEVKDFLPLEQLEEFQGNLKELTESSFKKLKASMLKDGFHSPVFVWHNKILDGHQRLRVLRELTKEGYELEGGLIPVVKVKADNEAQAKRILLEIVSSYGHTSSTGLYEFMNTGAVIELADVTPVIDIPMVDLDLHRAEFYEPEVIEVRKKEVGGNMGTKHKCPKCGHEWHPVAQK